MQTIWWQLPGPARFVANVERALRNGSSVVLCLPEHVPDRLGPAIRAAVGDDLDWRTIELDGDVECQPEAVLFDRFALQCSPDAIRTASLIASHPEFGGRVYWLSGVPTAAWPAWRAFLAEYSHASRACPLMERGLFCVPLTGELASDPPADDVCLAVHRWEGVVDSLDMLLYAAHALQDYDLPRVPRRLATYVIAGLALWDPTIVHLLAEASVPEMLVPTSRLAALAAHRAWDTESAAAPDWRYGMIDRFDGEEHVHSALLALADPMGALRRRIWSAQVAVLLPLVEAQRQTILGRFAGQWVVPFSTPFGDVRDSAELEISHICSQITSGRVRADGTMRRRTEWLRDVRNNLSHLRPVGAEALLQDGMLDGLA
jgi:hypothetical protein